MKAPKCPKCGKEHYSTQRCSAEAVCGQKVKLPSTSAAPADSSSKDSRVQSSVKVVSSLGSVKSPDVIIDEILDAQTAVTSTSGGPITNEVHRESSSGDQPVIGEARRKTVDHRPQPEGEDTAKPATVVVAESEVGNSSESLKMVQALTSAEKQKAYRKRLKDDPAAYKAYLEANKLRMRKKRETGDK